MGKGPALWYRLAFVAKGLIVQGPLYTQVHSNPHGGRSQLSLLRRYYNWEGYWGIIGGCGLYADSKNMTLDTHIVFPLPQTTCVAGWRSSYSGQYCHPHFSKDMGSNPAWGVVTPAPNFNGILGVTLWLPRGGSHQNNFLYISVWQANKWNWHDLCPWDLTMSRRPCTQR